jgi:predicted RNase H-like HicB family nuclease
MKDAGYEVVIYWSDEDDAYVAEVPELPGCAAHGDTREEAVRMIEEAIAGVTKVARELGHRLPKPKGRLALA